MKTYTTKELNANVYSYILNAINGDDYGIEFNNDTDKLAFLAERFKNEYAIEYGLKANKSYQDCFEDWIQGLPSSFNIACYNSEVLQLAHKWNSIPVNSTEREENKIIDNWFHFIAAKTVQLMSKHKIYLYKY